jgi:hypothetical protein
MMNHKLKQIVVRASWARKSLFQGSSSSSSRREAMQRCARDEQHSIAFQRSDDEEEEQRGEEENVGEGPNKKEEGEEDELERVLRQTQRSHMVAPPIPSTREEDRVPVWPLCDSKYILDLFSFLFYARCSLFLFIVFQFLVRHQI